MIIALELVCESAPGRCVGPFPDAAAAEAWIERVASDDWVVTRVVEPDDVLPPV